MKKTIITLASALLFVSSAFAQEAGKPQFKWYGFIRTYFAYDSRESTAGTEDLYYYMPKDQKLNAAGEDLNAVSSFRFAALTSRLGVDVTGYEFEGYKVGAKIEADFYSGVSGVTGTAQFRLRQAFCTIGKDSRTWKIGQAWTPMAADLPDIFSLESGAPFGPFSRSPQVTFEQKFSDNLSLTASAIWQMQYTSTGPEGAVANYIKYGCTPEIYLGANYKTDTKTVRFGVDVLSIKPRRYDAATSTKMVNDRLTTLNIFQFGQFKFGDFTVKEKIVYANDGSHMNLIGGYAETETDADGNCKYSATRTLNAWLTAQYKPKGSKWVPSIFLGYIDNLGTATDVISTGYFKNSAPSVASMFRVQPEVLYNLGKVSFGLEYMLTGVKYGKTQKRMVAVDDLHTVVNNRVQMMVKYTF